MATLEQIADALRKADAAGNVDDARALAAAYKQMVATAQPQQAAPADGLMSAQSPEFANLPVPGNVQPAPEQQYQNPIPGADAINTYAKNFGENIPIVGPLVTQAADQVGSNIASLITGKPAADLRAEVERVRGLEDQAQPLAAQAGEISGQVGPLMSLGTTAAGARAMGMTGPWWQRLLAGGMSGGAIAGGDELARSGNPNEAMFAALKGAGLGAAFPIAELFANPIINAMRGVKANAASNRVATNLQREGINGSNVQAIIDALGPQAVLADLGPNLTQQARAIAALPGEGQAIIRDALIRRQKGTNARIQGDVDTILGPSPVPSRVSAEIETAQQNFGPAYTEALNAAPPVNPMHVRSLASTFDDMAQRYAVGERHRVMQRIRGYLNETSDTGRVTLTRDPNRLFVVRNEIDGMMQGEANGQVIAALTSARQQVDDTLAATVPGFKQIDAQYQELARQNTALTGQGPGAQPRVLQDGPTSPHPVEVADMMSPEAASTLFVGPSGVPFRVSQRTRADIERIIGTTTNDLNAMKGSLKGDGSWNRDKLATVFGPEKADALIAVLDREMTFNNTAQRAIYNSETAGGQVAMKEAAPYQLGDSQNLIADILLKIPARGFNTAARARSEAINKQIADLLVGRPSPEVVDQLLAARAAGKGRIGSIPVPLLLNQ